MWLKEGDQNTKYFHQKASQRKKKKSISRIKDDAGTWRTAHDRDEVIVDYFKNLFSATENRQYMEVVEGIEPKMTEVMQAHLASPFSAEEVTAAIK